MADEGTAVLEPETIVEELETSAPEGEEETTADAAETEGAEGTPETEEEMVPAAEVAARIEAAKQEALTAQKAEAEEQAHAAAYKERQTRASTARQGRAYQLFQNAVQWAHTQGEEGKELRINPKVLSDLAVELDNMAFMEQYDALVASSDSFLGAQYPDFKPSKEVASKLERAARMQDFPTLVAAQHEKFLEAVVAELTPKLRKEIEAELKQRTSAAAKTQDIRTAGAIRSTAGRPTAGGDGGGASAYYQDDIDAIPDSQWMSLPQATRDAMRAGALKNGYRRKRA